MRALFGEEWEGGMGRGRVRAGGLQGGGGCLVGGWAWIVERAGARLGVWGTGRGGGRAAGVVVRGVNGGDDRVGHFVTECREDFGCARGSVVCRCRRWAAPGRPLCDGWMDGGEDRCSDLGGGR